MYRRSSRLVLFAALLVVAAASAYAWVEPSMIPGAGSGAKTLTVDGSYVMNVGELHMNVTNHGLIGSRYSIVSTFSDAPSAQWPGGSGIEYLFAAGLWVGGVKHGEKRVSTAQFQEEFMPPAGPDYTIYEAMYGRRTRPEPHASREGARVFEPGADDDGDGRVNEEMLNGLDDDRDGRIDEDFSMMGTQMMVCTMVDNTPISQELFPDHVPLDLRVDQSVFAWEMEDVDDFIVFSYDITNIGTTNVSSVLLGMYVDCDIGNRNRGESAFDDMAGRYRGKVRAPNGLFESVDVAYMYDANGRDPVPGYFGVMFRGPSQAQHSIRSFQLYTGTRPYALGGDATNDAERYNELAKTMSDPNSQEEGEADYRFLVSNGPWGTLRPGRKVHVEVVFVAGGSLEEMLTNCAAAQQAWEGAWYDLDKNPWTGRNGRETLACLEDYGYTLETFGLSPFKDWDARFIDTRCVPGWVLEPIVPEDLTQMGDKHCIWINYDNCDECEALRGSPCSSASFFNYWNCNNWWIPVGEKEGCTGVGGKESVVRWITDAAPPPPRLRVWAEDFAVHVFWSDEPEYSRDLINDTQDFESYQIWRADDWERPFGTSEETGPSSEQWHMIEEFDLENDYFETRLIDGVTVVDTLVLGDNTGLEPVVYRPRCLDDPAYAGLEEAMRAAFAHGIHSGVDFRPPIRDANGSVFESMASLVEWESSPAVLDTFFWATPWEGGPGDVPEKRGVRFYEYVDREVNNGFLYFYSVASSDHDMYDGFEGPILTGPGVEGDPATSFVTARPGASAHDQDHIARHGNDIYVYPNPATREALERFQEMAPNGDDPTGVRIMFTNLPYCRSLIRIFTLGGDLVDTIDHDGSTGSGEASWNLVSRNGQQIVSGVYLYSVSPQDGSYEDFIGKFVVIR
jgi:hypothetical protein